MGNITSEQQLKQLFEEGKINEDEYQQLLSSMNRPTLENPPLRFPENPKIPISLKIVAWLFIIGAIFAVIEILVGLTQNRISINFGVLGFFIGPGLLKLSRSWRTCALVFIWIGLILIPIFMLIALIGNLPAHLEFFGEKIARIPNWIAISLALPFFLLILWEYLVLTRPDIKSLFGINGQ